MRRPPRQQPQDAFHRPIFPSPHPHWQRRRPLRQHGQPRRGRRIAWRPVGGACAGDRGQSRVSPAGHHRAGPRAQKQPDVEAGRPAPERADADQGRERDSAPPQEGAPPPPRRRQDRRGRVLRVLGAHGRHGAVRTHGDVRGYVSRACRRPKAQVPLLTSTRALARRGDRCSRLPDLPRSNCGHVGRPDLPSPRRPLTLPSTQVIRIYTA